MKRLFAVVVVAVSLAACGGSSSSSSTSTTAGGSASTTAGASASAQAQIKANWEQFFSGQTQASTKISLLQNGDKFAAFINAQANSSTAKQASARVDKVTLDSSTQATVSYDLLLNGQVGLPNQTGKAVLDAGVWKVSDATFCALAALQNNGKPPAGC
jgi:hypothetical protein